MSWVAKIGGKVRNRPREKKRDYKTQWNERKEKCPAGISSGVEVRLESVNIHLSSHFRLWNILFAEVSIQIKRLFRKSWLVDADSAILLTLKCGIAWRVHWTEIVRRDYFVAETLLAIFSAHWSRQSFNSSFWVFEVTFPRFRYLMILELWYFMFSPEAVQRAWKRKKTHEWLSCL